MGRKRPIVWGYVASLVLLFPLFWGIGELANPGLAQAVRSAPIVICPARTATMIRWPPHRQANAEC